MKPTQTELLAWTKKHASRFAWTAASDIECLAEWATIQTKYGVTLDELHEVSEKMVMNTKDVFGKENHLKTLNTILHSLRERKSYAVIQDEDRGTCTTCGAGSGLVSVPEPREVVNGEWTGVKFTFVACSCPEGFRYRNSKDSKDRTLLNIEQYTRFNPLWKSQVKNYWKKISEENNVFQFARTLDGKTGTNLSTLDKIQLKIIGRMNDEIDRQFAIYHAGNEQKNLPALRQDDSGQIYEGTNL